MDVNRGLEECTQTLPDGSLELHRRMREDAQVTFSQIESNSENLALAAQAFGEEPAFKKPKVMDHDALAKLIASTAQATVVANHEAIQASLGTALEPFKGEVRGMLNDHKASLIALVDKKIEDKVTPLEKRISALESRYGDRGSDGASSSGRSSILDRHVPKFFEV